MARKSLSAELKKAISQLPPREKDKLLVRLITKDEKLTERLQFELLEDGATTELRREDISEMIEVDLRQLREHPNAHPAYLNRVLRRLSAKINRHLFVTKDKYGEVSLQLQMLRTCLEQFEHKWPSWKTKKARMLNKYIVQRIQKLQRLIAKLHEDYHLEFEDDLYFLSAAISQHALLRELADELGLEMESSY